MTVTGTAHLQMLIARAGLRIARANAARPAAADTSGSNPGDHGRGRKSPGDGDSARFKIATLNAAAAGATAQRAGRPATADSVELSAPTANTRAVAAAQNGGLPIEIIERAARRRPAVATAKLERASNELISFAHKVESAYRIPPSLHSARPFDVTA